METLFEFIDGLLFLAVRFCFTDEHFMTFVSFKIDRDIAEFITLLNFYAFNSVLWCLIIFHSKCGIHDEQDNAFVVNCKRNIISLHNSNIAYMLMY